MCAVLARVAAIHGDLERATSLMGDAVEAGVDGLPWMHASAYHDLRLFGPQQVGLPRALQVEQ